MRHDLFHDRLENVRVNVNGPEWRQVLRLQRLVRLLRHVYRNANIEASRLTQVTVIDGPGMLQARSSIVAGHFLAVEVTHIIPEQNERKFFRIFSFKNK